MVDPKGFAACFAQLFRSSARRLPPRLAGSSSDRSLPRLHRSLAVNARALSGSNPCFISKKPKIGLMACFRFLVDSKGFAACFASPFRPSARRLLPRLAGSSSDRSLPRLHRSLAVNARALAGSNPLFHIKKREKGVIPFSLFGGPEGVRTLGLRVANAALSQLSYEPVLSAPDASQGSRYCSHI